MNTITDKNINHFLEEYNNFHDSSFKNINYDIEKSSISIVFDAVKQIDNNFVRTNLTLLFTNVKEFKMKEIFSWDFIYDLVLKTETKNNETLFLFSDDINTPNILILCKEIYIRNK